MREPREPMNWLVAGALLGVLGVVVANKYLAGRLIGASSAFPALAGGMAGWLDQFRAGTWEITFLLGAFLGGLAGALYSGNFKIRFLPERWRQAKGELPGRRIVWALVGGFLLIVGARLAGGCTSGHMLSGGMQLALSSLLFGAVALTAAILTGRVFYR